MPFSRLARLAGIGLALIAGTNALCAQTSPVAGAVDATKMVALAGGVSPRMQVAKDLGETAGDKRLESMSLRFAMSAAQQAELTQLLADQQNPASGRYHQWLTPEQFGAEFGLPAADISEISVWLAGQGFAVTQVARGGLFVRFSGTVAQAEKAFHAQIHDVSVNGERHFANVTAPMLPEAIAAVTQGVTGLDDFRPKPRHREATVQPEYTTGAGVHYLAPGDFYTIYDEKSLIASGVTGSGMTIAIVGQTDINAGDIAAFQKASGLANKPVTQMLVGTDPLQLSAADLTESEMDLEWSGAIAPGASILYVYAANVIDGSLTQVVDTDAAPIVSSSYGACEADLGTNALGYYGVLLQQGSAEGMTITAAAGDSGATDCDVNVGSAVDGLAVDFPASSPFVTGVGGTRLNEGTGTYWSATNGANAGSATGYIPEVAWNDDNGAGLDATGGGASDYFSKPVWQTGTGVPNDYSRDVPDVSFAASINHDGYVVCVGETNCTNGYGILSGAITASGGTSVGAPVFAGLVALVEQKTGGKALGNVNPTIYALANSPYAGSVFHDVTSGTNASPCTEGSVNCAAGGTIGFVAGPGYDQATGWGSVDAAAMVADWALVMPVSVAGLGVDPSVTDIAGSATSVVAGTPIVFTVTVAPPPPALSPVPTGTTQVTVDSVPVGTAIALSAGAGTYTLATTGLSLGNHTVQATYSGDGTFAGSKGAFAIAITAAGTPDFALTPMTANVTVAGGSIAPTVVFTVSSLDGFAGSVSLTASSTKTLAAQTSFTANPVSVSATASGSTNFSLLAYTTNAQATGVPRPGGWYGAGSGVVLAGLLLVVLPRRRRLAGLMVVMLGVVAPGVWGCASSTPAPAAATTTPTPAGTYNVLISATATINGVVTTHSSTVTYVVQ